MGKENKKIRGIYINFDIEGKVPLICNCDYCKKRRKKSEVKMEYVSISEKIKELAENNINLIIAVPPPEISFPSIFQVKKTSSYDKDPLRYL